MQNTTMSSTSTQSIPQGKIVLTYDDYRDLPNDRNRYEIVDGELYVTPAPRPKHQGVSSHIHRVLANHVVTNQLGEIYAAPIDVILAPSVVLQPDLVFIANDRRSIITDRAIEGPPTLVSEILSPTTHRTDRLTKAQLYAKHRVPHYWLFDPDNKQLEAYELAGDHYNLLVRAQNDDVFMPALFPGLAIRLADIWV